MEYQPSFWMGLLCFLLFGGGDRATVRDTVEACRQ